MGLLLGLASYLEFASVVWMLAPLELLSRIFSSIRQNTPQKGRVGVVGVVSGLKSCFKMYSLVT